MRTPLEPIFHTYLDTDGELRTGYDTNAEQARLFREYAQMEQRVYEQPPYDDAEGAQECSEKLLSEYHKALNKPYPYRNILNSRFFETFSKIFGITLLVIGALFLLGVVVLAFIY